MGDMASIRERSRADGSSIKHEVLWRDSDTGMQDSYGLPSPEEALRFKRLIEANGNSLAAVEDILQKITIGGPTVAENLQRHIELLTSAGPDQIKRYGSAIRNHFSGRLGRLPVAAVEHEDVVGPTTHAVRNTDNGRHIQLPADGHRPGRANGQRPVFDQRKLTASQVEGLRSRNLDCPRSLPGRRHLGGPYS